MKRTAAVVLIILYCSPHAAGTVKDDGLGLLRDHIVDKSSECDSRYVATPFGGVGAAEAQGEAEKLYNECLKDLVKMAEEYMDRRSKKEGKSLQDWMKDSEEVSFSSDYGCYKLIVAKDYGSKASTFVLLPDKYNPPGTVWQPKIMAIQKPELDNERFNEIYKGMNSPHVHQRGINELKLERRRESRQRLMEKAKTAASSIQEGVNSLKSIESTKKFLLNAYSYAKLDVVKANIQARLDQLKGSGNEGLEKSKS